MTRALAATRAALTWIVLTASLVAAGLVVTVPATAADKTYTVASEVNVRSGASTSKAILGTLQKGERVLAAGSVSGDWLPIKYAATTAYVWADYLDADKTAATVVTSGPAGRKTTLENVNVRATASLDAAIATVITKGTAVRVTGRSSGSFAQVTVGTKTQWIYGQFLSTATDTTPEVVAKYTTTAELALRETAAVTAKNQVTIATGSTIGTTGTHSGSYSQVVHSGKVGWVITGFLKAVAGTPANLVLPLTTGVRYVTETGVTLRSGADAEMAKLATLDRGAGMRITGTTKNSFTEVIWAGATGWVATIYLSTTKPVTDLGSSSLNKLEPYGKAAVLEIREKFPQIKSIYGWRSSSAYSSDHPSGRAIDNMIPSYKSNKALGDAVAQYIIDNGTRLHVTYVIWRQRNYRMSRGYWVKMSDRGGDTANHMDHVHVSFEPS